VIHRVRGASKKLLVVASIGAAVLAFAAVAGAKSTGGTPLSNGGFEMGNLDGWGVAADGAAEWFASDKRITPITGLGWYGPADKEYAAVSDQDDPGGTVLYRYIQVGKGSRLEMYVYYKTRTSTFCDAGTLHATGCNQQFRIDIMDPSADPFSENPADVLMTVFHTKSNSPKNMNPKRIKVKLTGISGTVMLRIGVVGTEAVFNASVDDISINNGG